VHRRDSSSTRCWRTGDWLRCKVPFPLSSRRPMSTLHPLTSISIRSGSQAARYLQGLTSFDLKGLTFGKSAYVLIEGFNLHIARGGYKAGEDGFEVSVGAYPCKFTLSMKRLSDIYSTVTNGRSDSSPHQVSRPPGGSRCPGQSMPGSRLVFIRERYRREHITSQGGFDMVDWCVFASMPLTHGPHVYSCRIL